MSAVIYKQTLSITDGVQELVVPVGAALVSLGMDTRSSDIAIWYRFDKPNEPYTGPVYTRTWRLSIVGTGNPFPVSAVVLGTAASVALWLRDAIGRAFRDLRVDVVCPCGTCGGAR